MGAMPACTRREPEADGEHEGPDIVVEPSIGKRVDEEPWISRARWPATTRVRPGSRGQADGVRC